MTDRGRYSASIHIYLAISIYLAICRPVTTDQDTINTATMTPLQLGLLAGMGLQPAPAHSTVDFTTVRTFLPTGNRTGSPTSFKFDFRRVPSSERWVRAELRVHWHHWRLIRINLYQVSPGRPNVRVLIDTKFVKRTSERWAIFDVLSSVRSARRNGNMVELAAQVVDEDGQRWMDGTGVLFVYGSDEDETGERNRRHIGDKRHSGQCKRHRLEIRLEDLQWQDWVVAPQQYSAYYCAGHCDTQNATNHAIVQTLVNAVSPSTAPKPCCVPTQTSSVSLLHTTPDGNIVITNYPGMTVESCGCR